MKRGIALIICLFAMTIQAHLTHAADASSHEDESAPVKRKAYDSDDRDKRRKAACDRDRAYYAAHKEKIAAYRAAYRAANKEKIAAREAAYRAANKEKRLERLATGNPAALASLQDRIDKAQDQPGAGENPFLARYNDAYEKQQMNPATPGAVNAAEILISLVKDVQSEQAALRQGEDDSEEADAANFTPRTPYQALEDLLSGSEESPVEDD